MSQRALYFHMQPGILQNNLFSVIACLKSTDCNWMHRSIYHRFMFLCYFILELSSIMSGKTLDDYMQHWARKLYDPGLQLQVTIWRDHFLFCIFTCLNSEYVMSLSLHNHRVSEDTFLTRQSVLCTQISLITFMHITVLLKRMPLSDCL